MAKDWFRKTTWTDADRDDFDQRLQRARPYNKAQYLRIQAVTLIATGPAFARPAIALLDRLFAEYPEKGQMAAAYTAKAEALVKLGEIEPALEQYRAAIEQMRIFPHAQTWARLDFALLATVKGKRALYGKALEALAEHEATGGLPFHVNIFKAATARALIHYARNELPDTRRETETALRAAGVSYSGLRYHPGVGLVGTEYPQEIIRLKALLRAAAGNRRSLLYRWLYRWKYPRR